MSPVSSPLSPLTPVSQLSSTVVCVGIMLGGRSLPRTLTSSTLPSRWPCARAPSSGTERYRWQSAATCSRCGRMGWAACFEARAELSLPPPFFAREHSPRNSPPHGRSRPHLQASPSPTDPPRATSRSPLSTLTRCATLTNQLLPAAGLAEELEDGTGATMLQARAVGQRRTAAERGEGQERAGGDRWPCDSCGSVRRHRQGPPGGGGLPHRCVPRRTLAGASPPLGARPLRTAGHPRRALHHLRALGALLGHLRLHRQQRAAVFCRPPLKVARLRHARRARQGALNPPRRRSTPTLALSKPTAPPLSCSSPTRPHPLSRAGRDARQDAKGWQTGRPSSRYQRVAPHALVAPPPPPLRRPNPRRTPVAHPRRARCRPTTTSASTPTGAHALKGVRGGGYGAGGTSASHARRTHALRAPIPPRGGAASPSRPSLRGASVEHSCAAAA